MELKLGDIILGATETPLVWLMNIFQKDRVEYGHAMMAVGSNSVIE